MVVGGAESGVSQSAILQSMAGAASRVEARATLRDQADVLGPLGLQETVPAVATLVVLRTIQWEAHGELRPRGILGLDAMSGSEHVDRGDGVATATIALVHHRCQPIVTILVPPIEGVLTAEGAADLGGNPQKRRKGAPSIGQSILLLLIGLWAVVTNAGELVELPWSLARKQIVGGRSPAELQKIEGVSDGLRELGRHRVVEAFALWDPGLVAGGDCSGLNLLRLRNSRRRRRSIDTGRCNLRGIITVGAQEGL
mmetsp:Transcript_101288/g.290600  ORF Transcript_101288/g.290600 Transcript_101288/m.290600 type:complete len:255 (-) Transcript_101288:685-1449(-)